MPTAKLFNMAGDQVGEVALSEAVFGVEPNESVLHDSVKNHLANCRQGTQSALTKGEVSYTTAKPWRQKGTGRARAGYKGSPVWTHGGVAFAPKPRDYSYTLNKKVRRLALKSVLSAKAQSADIVVQNPELQQPLMRKVFQRDLCTVDLCQQPQLHTLAVLRNFCIAGNISNTANLTVKQTWFGICQLQSHIGDCRLLQNLLTDFFHHIRTRIRFFTCFDFLRYTVFLFKYIQ